MPSADSAWQPQAVRMDTIVADLLQLGDGMFTTASARAAGLTGYELTRAVRRKAVRRLTRGVYGDPTGPDATAADEHRVMCRAARLLHPDGVLTGISAVLAHGLPVLDESLNLVDIERPVRQEVLTSSLRIRPLRWPQADDEATWRQIPLVDLDSAIIQTTLDFGVLPGVVAADAAVHEGRLTLDEVQTWPAKVVGWPASGRVRALCPLVDGSSESPGESLVRVHMTIGGIDLVPQVNIRDSRGFVGRVDFLVRGRMVVLEFDGKVKFASGDPSVLWREKRREDRLRALGYVVIRIVWADLMQPAALLARVRAALNAAA